MVKDAMKSNVFFSTTDNVEVGNKITHVYSIKYELYYNAGMLLYSYTSGIKVSTGLVYFLFT